MAMKIVLADDDSASATLTTFLLETRGYQVLNAVTGRIVMDLLKHDQPALILLEVSLPDISGFDLCREIRRTSDVPIIFLTTQTQLHELVTGLQLGGDDYVTKPFEVIELCARMTAVIRRSKSATQSYLAPIQVADVTLDRIEQYATRCDGERIQLTPSEFRLLEYLMINAGCILSSEQIRLRVWGDDADAASNLVPVYIGRLRTKLEMDPSHPHYLITIRDQGYLFAR
jgi:DNA-binding response OmpR family regulator